MQIKLVEDELTHKELTYPMTPRFHLSVCLSCALSKLRLGFDHILFDCPCKSEWIK